MELTVGATTLLLSICLGVAGTYGTLSMTFFMMSRAAVRAHAQK